MLIIRFRLWDITQGKIRQTLQGYSKEILTVCFSPDGQTLASAGTDRIIRLWDVASGLPSQTLQEHKEEIHSVCFSPDGQTLAQQQL